MQDGPLSGVKILDLSRVLSGPFATQQLVDLGAQVIKIEHPVRGDDTRAFGPPFVGSESTYFMSINRGKKSVAIDLKNDRGRDLMLRLASICDVAIENFRPGTAERLGLGVPSLREARPDIITCSISGFGTGGVPEIDSLPGYDALIQAVSGLMSITGAAEGPPTRVGVAIADLVSGLYAAQGILAAIVERGKTGKGSHIDISMQECVCSLLSYQAGSFFATGTAPKAMGNAHPSICPYETIKAKDGMYMLACGNDSQFGRLAELIGKPELKEHEHTATNRARVVHRDEVMNEIVPFFARHTRAELDELLQASGVPGAPILDVAQALQHPQVTARKTVLTHTHKDVGDVKTVRSPARLDSQEYPELAAPPTLGQHTADVLSAELGLDAKAIEELRAAQVIGD